MNPIDLTGHKFGRWSVIERAANTTQGQAQWRCRCECGNEKVLKSILIRRGISKSCGCWKLEGLVARSTKHGHSSSTTISPTYHTWAGMLARCRNPSHSVFHYYGGRGISVCKRWNVFANFLADMGEKPIGTSLERLDYSKDYKPSNCVWANAKQQANNKSNNRLISANGQTRTLAQWADEIGIHPQTIISRLETGWNEKDAVTLPSNPKRKGRKWVAQPGGVKL